MRSTIDLAGHSFPLVGLVCPGDPPADRNSEFDRSLGVRDLPYGYRYIPAENGILFELDGSPDNLCMALVTIACRLETSSDCRLWLPIPVGLVDGELVTGQHRSAYLLNWHHAEPEWLAETITRLSTKSFDVPAGPRALMVDPDAILDGYVPADAESI